MPFCRNCGGATTGATQFCSKCGKPLVAAAVPVAKRSGTGRKLGIAVVIALGFIALSAIIGSETKPSGSSASAVTSNVPTDRWQVREDRSPMDDSNTVMLSLDSGDVMQGPLGTVTPSLIVRCQEGKTSVYVVTGMAASIEEDIAGGPSEFHKVRIRLDDGAVSYESWGESTDHKALFASVHDSSGDVAAFSGGAAEFAKKLAGISKLTFQFTPFDGSPQVARFDVRGLDNHLGKVAEACHWHVDENGRRF